MLGKICKYHLPRAESPQTLHNCCCCWVLCKLLFLFDCFITIVETVSLSEGVVVLSIVMGLELKDKLFATVVEEEEEVIGIIVAGGGEFVIEEEPQREDEDNWDLLVLLWLVYSDNDWWWWWWWWWSTGHWSGDVMGDRYMWLTWLEGVFVIGIDWVLDVDKCSRDKWSFGDMIPPNSVEEEIGEDDEEEVDGLWAIADISIVLKGSILSREASASSEVLNGDRPMPENSESYFDMFKSVNENRFILFNWWKVR